MRFAAASAFILAGLCAPAHAVSIDFTDRSVWSSAASTTTVLGALVTLSSNPAGQINFNQDFDGAPALSPFCGEFACVSDGLGVRDDEITTTETFTQSVTVSFSKAVRVVGFAFLDLFVSRDGGTREVAQVAFDGGPVSLSFDAVETVGGGRPGFLRVAIPGVTASSITFTADLGNDAVGRADFALAGIDVAPIPLPAAGWMLVGALGGMALLRRKRAAAA